MLPIAKIAKPRLERGRVCLLHRLAVGVDLGRAGNRSPLAGAIEEGDVDMRIA